MKTKNKLRLVSAAFLLAAQPFLFYSIIRNAGRAGAINAEIINNYTPVEINQYDRMVELEQRLSSQRKEDISEYLRLVQKPKNLELKGLHMERDKLQKDHPDTLEFLSFCLFGALTLVSIGTYSISGEK